MTTRPVEEEKHWPDAAIEDLEDDEREMLLRQAGPTGEMARHAWQQYQEREEREGGVEEPHAVEAEQRRLQEMGQTAGSPTDPNAPMTGGGTVTTPGAGGTGAGGVSGTSEMGGTAGGTNTSTTGTNTPAPSTSTPSTTGPANTVNTTSTSGPAAGEVIDTPEEEAAETGTQTERQQAEARAAELGLEVRDAGSAGDWRVYDPKTGRQVAKSTVLAPAD
jgi:hypothetical protein